MEYIGSRVKFLDEEDVYTGTLKSVNQSSGRLSIDNVECNGKAMKGIQFFFQREITGFEVIEEKPLQPSLHLPDDGRGRSFLHQHMNNSHLSRLENVRESFMNLRQKADKLKADGEDGYQIPIRENSTFRSEKLNQTITVIGKMDERFDEAIACLQDERVIGVGLQGVEIGRTGTLSLIQFSLRDCILIFDILTLGKAAFENGLTAILQNFHIVKVIHDCRYVSDMLFHKYGVKLTNVFDTQVADAVIFRIFDHRDRYPKRVNSLKQCHVQYLNDDTDDAYPHRVRLSCQREDEQVWERRPLSQYLVENAARRVHRLITLREVMMEQLVSEVHFGTDLFLAYVRDQPDELCINRSERLARLARRQNHELPPEFINVPKLVKDKGMETDYGYTHETERGMADNCSGFDTQSVIYSKTGAWFHRPKGMVAEDVKWVDKKKPDSDSDSDKSKSVEKLPEAIPSVVTKSPERVNPLLKPAVRLQRSRLSANMALPNNEKGSAGGDTCSANYPNTNLKPAGVRDSNPIRTSRPFVPIEDLSQPPELISSDEFDIIPSHPQKPVFSSRNNTSSDEQEH